MIQPTVGRKVWFYLNGMQALSTPITAYSDQPMDATIVYVHSAAMVNLFVVDHAGRPHSLTSVPLLSPENEDAQRPYTGFYAAWMPYQIRQAAKEKAAEPGESVGLAETAMQLGEEEPCDCGFCQARREALENPAIVDTLHVEPVVSDADLDAVIVGERRMIVPGTDKAVCVLTLRNGSVVVGMDDGFDPTRGADRARENAIGQLREREQYLLKQREYDRDRAWDEAWEKLRSLFSAVYGEREPRK